MPYGGGRTAPDPNAKDNCSYTPLHKAAKKGKTEWQVFLQKRL
ncbi:MAG: ankyrin repeat domain-containing protein [Brevinema sp.]